MLEAGVGWLPYWMERLDEHYELMPEYVPFLRRKPSEVIRSENFFISCDPDEATLPYVANVVGSDHIFYASDYPHFDGRFPNTVKFTADRPEFSMDGSAPDPAGKSIAAIYAVEIASPFFCSGANPLASRANLAALVLTGSAYLPRS